MSASENQVVVIKKKLLRTKEDRSNEVEGVMKNRLFWNIIVCQFEICDPYNNQRSGKMPMSTGITILMLQ